MENLFLYQKAKAPYSSIIKSIFINILHKLKRKIYSWHLLCLKLSSNIANDNKRDQVHDEKNTMFDLRQPQDWQNNS